MFILVLSFDSNSERDKFEYIFNKYRRLMLYKAYEILHDYHLSEDAASEAFIRIYKNIHKIGDPTSNQSISFVITIVKNVALTILKREYGHAFEEYDETQPSDINIEEQTLSRLGSEEIYQMVDSLGEELKSVFMLRYTHELSHKQIGKLLGISENNVTVRLHRAKKRLAEMLKYREREIG